MRKNVLRAVTEAGFIVFLFYANLLMGEYTHTGEARGRGLLWALNDIFTATNLVIALIAALIGYLVVEFVRDRL